MSAYSSKSIGKGHKVKVFPTPNGAKIKYCASKTKAGSFLSAFPQSNAATGLLDITPTLSLVRRRLPGIDLGVEANN